MAGVSRAHRDEVIFHLRRAREREQLDVEDYHLRVAIAQQTDDCELLAALVDAGTPTRFRPAEPAGFRPPPNEPTPDPAQVARLERRAREIGAEVSLLTILTRLGLAVVILIGSLVVLLVAVLVAVNGHFPEWTTLPLLLVWVLTVRLAGVRVGRRLSALARERRQQRARLLLDRARLARMRLAATPLDVHRADQRPGAEPTPRPPRDSFTAD